MKKFLIITGTSLALTAIVHVILWFQNKNLYHENLHQFKHHSKDITGNIRFLRIHLEEGQKESLKNYKWINKEKGYVQIPVDRAFDYYLQSLPES